jgi:cytochrome P450
MNQTLVQRPRGAFPIGASLTLAELVKDPYPAYARLRESEPISWVPALNMWYVTRHDYVRQILLNSTDFTTASDHSLIVDTFGANMLTTEGSEHRRHRVAMQQPFSPMEIRQRIEPAIVEAANRLIRSIGDVEKVELRSAFAARLPVQTMLLTFGLRLEGEPVIRRCYDAFEQALANFTNDEKVRADGRRGIAELFTFFAEALRQIRAHGGDDTLLGDLLNGNKRNLLSDDEICRNLAVIFFGGISTVEGLILNAVWALAHSPDTVQRVNEDRGLIGRVIDETMRWLGPVQSATRHVTRDREFTGIQLREGDIVNCMLGGANHDPDVFTRPEIFDIDRPNLSRHLGFATGEHLCLGSRLAKAEAAIALPMILDCFGGLDIVENETTSPEGCEFRQPKALTLRRVAATRAARTPSNQD